LSLQELLIIRVIVVDEIKICVARENIVVNFCSGRSGPLFNSDSISVILNRIIEDLDGIGARDDRLINSCIIIMDDKANQGNAFHADSHSSVSRGPSGSIQNGSIRSRASSRETTRIAHEG
jgi:hypothetical protein